MKKVFAVLFLVLLFSGCVPIMEGMETWFYEDVVGMPLDKTDGTEEETVIVTIGIDWGDE